MTNSLYEAWMRINALQVAYEAWANLPKYNGPEDPDEVYFARKLAWDEYCLVRDGKK